MHTAHSGATCATGSAAVHASQTGAADFSSDADADRTRLHNAITRAWHRRDAAKKKADFAAYEGADDDLKRLVNQLARLPVVGRVPSQDVDANAPGYAPGLSRKMINPEGT